MKIALVHDYLIRFGGAERVFLSLLKIFHQADVYTLLYDPKRMGSYFSRQKVHTSFLQKTPFSLKKYRYLLPLIPSAVESLDLREYDLVISSSNAFIKGLILRPKTVHVCYCHNPARFLWDYSLKYDGRPACLRKIIFHYLRIWDRAAAHRVDYFVANSYTTAQRIEKFYRKKAEVIYPPVALSSRPEKFFSSGDYFLIVSQLTPYKRIDLAIDAFNKLDLPLVIIGQGRNRKKLEKMAGPKVRFLGWQPDEVVRRYYQNCLAFIFPGEDDFGIAPVEAMGFGKPVLAFRRGGASETVVEGITGEFFDDPAPESLADGVRRLLWGYQKYDPLTIRKRAEKFSAEKFERSIKEFVIKALEREKILGRRY